MKKAFMGILVIGLVVLAALGVFAYQDYKNPKGNAQWSMDEMHKYMVSQVDPETANYMNRMHASCLQASL